MEDELFKMYYIYSSSQLLHAHPSPVRQLILGQSVVSKCERNFRRLCFPCVRRIYNQSVLNVR